MSKTLTGKTLKEKIIQLANEYLEFAKENSPNSYAKIQSKVKEEFFFLLEDDKPRIMVYGIYNAGKSTLVNCLLREELAETADRPMTDSISLYETDTYTLIDSPGVDAPIEHEKVTNEFLSKCHAILFVMSSKGGFESRENYTRLVDLMNKGLPFIIVLNERSVPIPKNITDQEKEAIKIQHAKDIEEIKDKIMKNVIEIGGDKNIARRYQVINVNAKKSLAGLKADKPLLFKQGNIHGLESKITQVISSNIDKLLIQPIENLKVCIEMCETELVSKNSKAKNSDYSNLVEIINLKINNLRSEAALYIDHLLTTNTIAIKNAYLNKNQSELERIINDIKTQYSNECQNKVNICADFIQKNCSDVYSILKTSNVDSYSNSNINLNLSSVSDREEIKAGTAISIGDNVSTGAKVVGTVAGGGAAAAAAAAALPLIPLAAPIAAAVVGIGSIFASVASENKKRDQIQQQKIELENKAEEMRVAQEMRIEQEASVAATSLAFEIKNTVNNNFELYINEYQYSVMNKIKEIELKEQENAVETKLKIEELEQFSRDLSKIKSSI